MLELSETFLEINELRKAILNFRELDTQEISGNIWKINDLEREAS
jgi:hypothetical protein